MIFHPPEVLQSKEVSLFITESPKLACVFGLEVRLCSTGRRSRSDALGHVYRARSHLNAQLAG